MPLILKDFNFVIVDIYSSAFEIYFSCFREISIWFCLAADSGNIGCIMFYIIFFFNCLKVTIYLFIKVLSNDVRLLLIFLFYVDLSVLPTRRLILTFQIKGLKRRKESHRPKLTTFTWLDHHHHSLDSICFSSFKSKFYFK